MTGSEPHTYIKSSVWCSGTTYFIDGNRYKISNNMWSSIDSEQVKKKLDKNSENNLYKYFNRYIERFINANKKRLNCIKHEAFDFIRKVDNDYPKLSK